MTSRWSRVPDPLGLERIGCRELELCELALGVSETAILNVVIQLLDLTRKTSLDGVSDGLCDSEVTQTTLVRQV